ncbi:molybdate ABC transporter substrate-binding protein [Virgibacillus halophilus]|uniref:molybdate ABC transporter substrate-binding protein n=1 Tax=Tigheibacillus halophilus TaxID=361280 RepID=UPI003625D1ED
MKRLILLLLLIVPLIVSGCSSNKDNTSTETSSSNNEKVPLTVSAAVSLTDALEKMKKQYEKDHAVDLKFNLAGSGTLAQQIQQGAPADIFISANEDWMDTLEKDQDIISDTRKDITGNRIVMITGKDSDYDISSIADIDPKKIDQVAIGNPESVPAGKYTKQTLENSHLWDTLSPKVVQAKDVRQVLSYVETGNTDIGFVYESDAKISDKIKILATADQDLHDPIIYPGAVTSESKHKKEAKEFMTYLQSDEAQKILEAYGFQK